ncbi:MAG: thioredoxin domain-containing protein [Pseudohongiellaceae bacterium]
MQDSFQSDKLESRLRRVEQEKEGGYDKRTEHIDSNGESVFINRLVLEDSPYLLQHAHNPVNWFPWGSEAFATAKKEKKPVFLSIGYSTCHWCHVMEVESFDNVEVAKVLNQHFISIKMDREQYPDIDEIYMTGVQLMSGQGGWPMSNFLLSDGKPFFGATYFPAPSFINLLEQIAGSWSAKYQEIESSAVSITEAINRILNDRKESESFDERLVENMLQALSQREDKSYGGLAGQPKFPQEPLLLFMLDQVAQRRALSSWAFVDRALEGMARGGLYDQVAGGFHRYSVDSQWLVPHFEKMMYNQSQLSLTYLQAFQLSGNPFFERICRNTLNYVLRDMQLPEGGFYSATDADSEGEEGTFFVWKPAELLDLMSESEYDFFTSVYGVSDSGNFEGSNILCLNRSLFDQAADQITHEGQEDFYQRLDKLLNLIYHAREHRQHPLRDDKVIVAWASAMATSLAKASEVIVNKDWLLAAERTVDLIARENVLKDNSLKRIYLQQVVSIAGQLEDYANYCQALLTLFDITRKTDYFSRAVVTMNVALAEFWDDEADSFYLSPLQQVGPLLTRSRNASDGAILSPVATALECLYMLSRREALLECSVVLDRDAEVAMCGEINAEANKTNSFNYLAYADRCAAALTAHINENPMSHASLLRVLATKGANPLNSVQYAGGGRARVALCNRQRTTEGQMSFEIEIVLQAGWHVTAPFANSSAIDLSVAEPVWEDGNIPLQVFLQTDELHWELQDCSYPEFDAELDFSGKKIPIYEDHKSVTVNLIRSDHPANPLSFSPKIEVTLQLCNDQSCLLPETLEFLA